MNMSHGRQNHNASLFPPCSGMWMYIRQCGSGRELVELANWRSAIKCLQHNCPCNVSALVVKLREVADLKQQKGNMTRFSPSWNVLNSFIHLCTHEKVLVPSKEICAYVVWWHEQNANAVSTVRRCHLRRTQRFRSSSITVLDAGRGFIMFN